MGLLAPRDDRSEGYPVAKDRQWASLHQALVKGDESCVRYECFCRNDLHVDAKDLDPSPFDQSDRFVQVSRRKKMEVVVNGQHARYSWEDHELPGHAPSWLTQRRDFERAHRDCDRDRIHGLVAVAHSNLGHEHLIGHLSEGDGWSGHTVRAHPSVVREVSPWADPV